MKTRKLSVYLSRWCKKNGFDCNVRYGSDFEILLSNNTIHYALLIPDSHDRLFAKVFENEGLLYTCDNFILSFFHELGHYMTEDEWTEKQSLAFMEEKEKLNDDDFGCWKYYHIADEIRATQWAVDFINDNPTLIADFWADVQERIMEIYNEVQPH